MTLNGFFPSSKSKSAISFQSVECSFRGDLQSVFEGGALQAFRKRFRAQPIQIVDGSPQAILMLEFYRISSS